MLKLNISHQAAKFLKSVHPKHGKQLATKIIRLRNNPKPNDSRLLRGNSGYRRTDIGEYRIIYYLENDVLQILIIAKRNDNDVYKKFKRKVK